MALLKLNTQFAKKKEELKTQVRYLIRKRWLIWFCVYVRHGKAQMKTDVKRLRKQHTCLLYSDCS